MVGVGANVICSVVAVVLLAQTVPDGRLLSTWAKSFASNNSNSHEIHSALALTACTRRKSICAVVHVIECCLLFVWARRLIDNCYISGAFIA